MFDNLKVTEAERAARRRGDALVEPPDVVMDRGFNVPGPPDEVWPWIVQLGKRRAGWYLSSRVERIIPPARRASRRIEPRWQKLTVGDVIPDYGGRHATFTVAELEAPQVLVYRSQRGAMRLTWCISLAPITSLAADSDLLQTRVLLRLRMGSLKRVWLARSAGELIDLVTVAGLATGLRERLRGPG